MTDKIYGVTGMSCASCAAHVQKVVFRLDGIEAAEVNIATEKLSVKYDESRLYFGAIKKAVADAGYTPVEIDGEKAWDFEKKRGARETRGMRIRLITASVFALPVLYIAMSHIFPKLGIPIPGFMDPHRFPLVFALVQLFLTVPVIIAGSRFFTKGFKTLFKGAPNMDTLIAISTGSTFLYSVYAAV